MRGWKNERIFLRGERVPRADQTLQSGTDLLQLDEIDKFVASC